MTQNANRYCCYGRGGIFVCATGVGTIGLEPDFNTLTKVNIVPLGRRRPVENRIKLGNLNGRNVDG